MEEEVPARASDIFVEFGRLFVSITVFFSFVMFSGSHYYTIIIKIALCTHSTLLELRYLHNLFLTGSNVTNHNVKTNLKTTNLADGYMPLL